LPLSAGTRLGAYELRGHLGSGGMGDVYRGVDPRLGREVAIKVLPPSMAGDAGRQARFEQEARAAAALAHPNLLVVYDVGSDDGCPFIVSELLAGETLRQCLQRDGRLSQRRAVDIALQVVAGLAAAHAGGIVHRDLKPENIFLCSDGRVKILDFGLAKLLAPSPLEQRTRGPSLTAEGSIPGTVAYMSPEQIRGRDVDARTDIWSFGAVLYEMLSGRQAFAGDSAADTMSAILAGEPPELLDSGVQAPASLERVVRHCLEKSAAQRFQAAADIAFDLEELRGVSRSGGARRPARIRAWWSRWQQAVAGALLGAALVLVAALLWRSAGQAPVRFQRLTFRRGALETARFAHDGQTFVYSAAWEGTPSEVFAGRVESPEARSLGLRGRLLALSSQGEVLVRDTDDVLQRLSLAGGAPRPVLGNVLTADWSPDGRQIAIVRWLGGFRERLEYPIGRPLVQHADGEIRSVRVSPTGDAVAFIDQPSRGTTSGDSLRIVDRQGTVRVLSSGWDDIGGIAWSPAGDAVWFSGSRTGRGYAILAVTRAGKLHTSYEGPGALRLKDVLPDGRVLLAVDDDRAGTIGFTPDGQGERELSWFDYTCSRDLSPDASTILMSEYGASSGANGATYVRPMSGGPAVRIAEGMGEELSPDGRLAIVTTDSPPRLLLVPTGAGETRSIGLPGWHYSGPARWFPDGARILVAARQSLTAEQRSYEVRITDGRLRAVTPPGVTGDAISPDGAWVAAYDMGRGVSLYPVAGGEPRFLPAFGDNQRPVRFSGDGRYLFAFGRGSVPLVVSRLDLRTGVREVWRKLVPADRAGVDNLANVRLTPDGTSYVYTYWRRLSTLYLVSSLR